MNSFGCVFLAFVVTAALVLVVEEEQGSQWRHDVGGVDCSHRRRAEATGAGAGTVRSTTADRGHRSSFLVWRRINTAADALL